MRALVLLLPLVAGCYSYVRPGDTSPLPAAGFVLTRGGQRLDVDAAGGLMLGHAPDDIEAALGVSLEAGAGGLTVTELRQGTEGHVVALEPGDVLLEARPLAPWLPAELRVEGAPGIEVRELDDLRGLAAVEGLELGLRVRRGDREVLLRQPLRRPTLVATRPWAPALAAELGVELARLDDWPASRLPAEAGPEDYLVVRVQAGSPAAVAGLRPLDVIDNDEGLFDLRLGNIPPELAAVAEQLRAALDRDPAARLTTVRRTDGRSAALELTPPRAPRDSGLLLLWGYQANHVRSHFGLLPLDLLFHHATDAAYDPLTDTFSVGRRWSLLTIFQVQSAKGGAHEGLHVSVNPFADEPRLRYLLERIIPGAGVE